MRNRRARRRRAKEGEAATGSLAWIDRGLAAAGLSLLAVLVSCGNEASDSPTPPEGPDVVSLSLTASPVCNAEPDSVWADTTVLRRGRASVQLHTGLYRKLEAVPLDGEGNRVSAEVEWTASPDSVVRVGRDGLVVGRGPGTGSVRAEAGDVSRSVSVSVESLDQTAHPHEPEGLRAFATHTWSRREENGWNFQGEATLRTSSDAPLSPPSVARVVYPAGFNGEAPVNAWLTDWSADRIYVQFAFRMSPNWFGHTASSANKIFFLWSREGKGDRPAATTVIKAHGAAEEPLTLAVVTESGGVNNFPNRGCEAAGTIERSSWHTVEILAEPNEGTRSDGSLEIWLDAVKVFDRPAIRLANAPGSHPFFQLQWNPIYGGVFDDLPVTQWMEMDHIYLSTPGGSE